MTHRVCPPNGNGDRPRIGSGARIAAKSVLPRDAAKFHDLWCEPYRVDITSAVRQGANTLKVSVTDTWFNRLVYDAGQPESNRKTWTISGPKKDAPLRDSGLIGPVRIVVGK